MSFPKYPEYKDSGVEWLGEVPRHWCLVAVKRIAKLKSGDTIGPESIAEEGIYPVYGGNGLRGYTHDYTHEGFYPLIGRQGALCGNVNYGHGRFWASEHAIVVSQCVPVVGKWLGELFRSMELGQYSVSAAQPGLSVDIINNLRVPVPSLVEQSAIAAFLDHETAKIDALIAEQEKLVELLKEKRQAVISHAVTKGLDPNVPMKDSGVEWLGEVPEHWELCRVKHFIRRIEQGWSPEAIDRLAEGEEWGVLKAGCVNYGRFREEEHKTLPHGVTPPQSMQVAAGDILMSRANGSSELIGSVAMVPSCVYRLIISDKIFRIIEDERKVNKIFFVFLAWSKAMRTQISLSISGAEGLANNIGKGAIKDFLLALPPLNEQQNIVQELSVKCSKIDELIEAAKNAISLLKERRSALISAAVTGKIDVRGFASVSEAV